MPYSRVLHLKVNLGSFAEFVETICRWSEEFQEQQGAKGRYVCAAPVALCMENFWDEDFRRICDEADLISPDGRPIVWALRKLGHRQQQQVSGPDLMSALCCAAARRRIPIGLYGATQQVLEPLRRNLLCRYPGLRISYAYAPPLRAAGQAAAPEELDAICQSGARLLFIGIGCPKQEIWMAQHRQSLPLVMLGVGAAFLFHSGEVRRAPLWLRRCALEWLFRLLQEPRRLFRRYFRGNLAYLWHTGFLSRRRLQKYLE